MKNDKRREKLSDSVFRISEILLGASLINYWISEDIGASWKLSIGVVIMLLLAIAFCICPKVQRKDSTHA